MKVLVYVPFARHTPHFETDLELVERHLVDGDEVTVVACNAHLTTCDVNPEHRASGCFECMGRRKGGIEALSSRVQQLPLVSLDEQSGAEVRNLVVPLESLASLTAWHIDTFDIGYGVLSSLISHTRESTPDLDERRWFVNQLARSAFAVYRTAQRYLRMQAYDRVYVYNGRYAPMRAVLRACQGAGVECYTHERGSTLDRYSVWRNSSPHDLEQTVRTLRGHWDASEADPRRDELAHQFYSDRRSSISRNWVAFTGDHEPGRLPEGWDPSRNNIAVFVSSEDEFAAIGDVWRNPLYATQIEGIQRIAASLMDDPGVVLYVRTHPNLKGLDNSQTRALYALAAPNLRIIPADSSISTYALLCGASVAVSFGSTVGIEATYWDVPSVLAGMSFYRELGVTHNPETHDELVDLLRSPPPPKPREATLPYGYFWQTFGTPFRYFEPSGLFSGRFKGIPVRPTRLYRVLRSASARAGLSRLSDWLIARHSERAMRPR